MRPYFIHKISLKRNFEHINSIITATVNRLYRKSNTVYLLQQSTLKINAILLDEYKHRSLWANEQWQYIRSICVHMTPPSSHSTWCLMRQYDKSDIFDIPLTATTPSLARHDFTLLLYFKLWRCVRAVIKRLTHTIILRYGISNISFLWSIAEMGRIWIKLTSQEQRLLVLLIANNFFSLMTINGSYNYHEGRKISQLLCGRLVILKCHWICNYKNNQ